MIFFKYMAAEVVSVKYQSGVDVNSISLCDRCAAKIQRSLDVLSGIHLGKKMVIGGGSLSKVGVIAKRQVPPPTLVYHKL